MNNGFYGGFDAPAFRIDTPRPARTLPAKTRGRGGTLTSFISEGGAVGGAAAGATVGSVVPVLGTAIGGVIGAGLGAFGGRLLENQVRDDRLGVGDAAKEGALSAVLAGPLKLGKYAATAGKAGLGGNSLATALTTGAKAADKSGIRNAAAGALNKANDKFLINSYRLTPTQLTNFKNKYGEDASEVVRRYGLSGKDSTAIRDEVIGKLQGEYDNIAGQIPDVSKKTVADAFKSRIGKLSASGVEDNMNIGKQLDSQLNTLLKKYGDNIPATELNKLRREFDSLVTYADKTANPARYGVNKRAADTIRKVLQDQADAAGLKTTTGGTFKEVGQELSKIRQLTDNISRQENLGRGSLPFGITPLLGAIAGTGGGPAGMAATMAATGVVNSTTGRKAIAKGAEKGAKALLPGAGKVRTAVGGALKGAQSQLFEGMLNPQSENISESMSPMNNTNPNETANNIPPEYSDPFNTSTQAQAASPFDPSNVEANVTQILSNGGDMKDVGDYLSLVEALQKVTGGGATKPLSAEASKTVANVNTGLQSLDQLESILSTDPSARTKQAIPGRGVFGGILGNALGTSSYDAAQRNIIDVITRLRTGAAITESEERFYRSMMPAAFDPPETVRQKLDMFRNLFESVSNRTGSAGTDTQSALGL